VLGVTTYVTTDIAPVPLLWTIPLALYLLSFVLVFARKPPVPHHWMQRALPVTVLAVVVGVLFVGVWQALPIHLLAFFVGAMVFHGELAAARPAAQRLTSYYLWIAVGGLAGGVLNALVAPALLPVALEYPLTIVLACAVCSSRTGGPPSHADRRAAIVLLGALALVVAGLLQISEPERSRNLFICVVGAMPVLVVFHLLGWRRLFALVTAIVLIADVFEPVFSSETLYVGRSFFGVHRVVRSRDNRFHCLMHGTTVHGMQGLDPRSRSLPLAYHHPSGPLGQIFGALANDGGRQRIAVVGLGAGATLGYRRAGQEFVFYEIDPLVRRIAEDHSLFTYLGECEPGGYRVVLGDGRLGLSRAKDRSFRMIFLDAFSSDAVPVHLLTRQAVELYLSKLDHRGMLVFQVTNAYLDLEPALAALARDAGLLCLAGRDSALSDTEVAQGRTQSHYVVLTRNRERANDLSRCPNWTAVTSCRHASPWTDDFSNILGALKWR